jgi:hypothetical protein
LGLASVLRATDVPNDYTALRNVERADRTATIVSVRVTPSSCADLTDFERKVLETSLNPYYGWQADVARNTLNPNTGEPYTRMWTAIALKNAHEKVRVCPAKGSVMDAKELTAAITDRMAVWFTPQMLALESILMASP